MGRAPTTGLDPVNTAAIERLITRLSDELHTTSLLVTHDVEGGLEMCDRVAMLEGGRPPILRIARGLQGE